MIIIPRSKHIISHKKISKNALKVIYRLNKAGYKSYLVGGSIRDLILGIKPKDFDIATNATPEQIRKLFHNCRLIGRRFQLAHIIFSSEIIEVATFRGHHQTPESKAGIKNYNFNNNNGMIIRDNIFGSIEEDAERRDFSINCLYYNISDFSLLDYTGGFKDLQKGVIRLIGHPETRYREDPIRMLRAVRFSVKLRMNINYETAEPIPRMASLLHSIPSARLFEETVKLLQNGFDENTYHLLRKYNLFQPLFPLISNCFTNLGESYVERMIICILTNKDQKLTKNMQNNLSFLFAAILWYPLLNNINKIIKEKKISYFNAFSLAINNIITEQCVTLAIPKKLTILIRDIWILQLRLSHINNKNAYKLIEHPKFNSAYYLMKLRTTIENNVELNKLSNWWRNFK